MFGQLLDWWRTRQADKTRSVSTAFGDFTRVNATSGWYGWAGKEWPDLGVHVIDVDNQPNPQFMERLPEVLRHLPEYEAAARKAVPQIEARFKLDSLDGNQLETDFSLSFYYEESEDADSFLEEYTVFFKDGRVVNSDRFVYDPTRDDELDEEDADEPEILPPSSSSSPSDASPWASDSGQKGNEISPWS